MEAIGRPRPKESPEGELRVNEAALSRLRPNRSDGKELQLNRSLSRSGLMSRIRSNDTAISHPRLIKKQREVPVVEVLSRP